MKTKLIPLVLLAAAASVARADVTLVNETLLNGVSSRSTMWIKGDKVRVDNDTTSSVIMDAASGDMTTLVHEQKMKITTNTKQLHALAAGAAGGGAKPQEAKITRTGEMETIDGHECEIILSESAGTVVKLWMAKDYPDQEQLRKELKVMEKMAAPNAPKQPDLPGVVLKTEYEQGGFQFSTRLVSISTDPVEASRFEIPADYKAP